MPLRDRDFDLTLPMLPETAAAVARFFTQKNSRNRDLQAIGLRDPALAITLYRLLGELRPSVADDVSDLAHAISLIGRDTLRRHLASQPVLQADATTATALRLHYSQSAHAACFGRTLAGLRGLTRLEQAAGIAALANPAPMLLAALDPESALRAANAVRSGVPWTVAYGAELQPELNPINGSIAERWSLPQAIRQTARGESLGSSIMYLASAAANLGLHAVLGWDESGVGATVAGLAETLGREPDDLRALVHRTAVSAGRQLAPMNFPLAAFDLILLEGEVELDADEQTKLDRVLHRLAQPPTAPPAHGPNEGLHVVVTHSIKAVAAIEGVQRSAFFLLSDDRKQLRVRLSASETDSDRIPAISLSLAKQHLFTRLLGKAQSLWFNPDNCAKLRKLLPNDIRNLVEDREFFAMSLLVDQRPLGILFADGGVLNESGYRRFRRTCQDLTATLAERRWAA